MRCRVAIIGAGPGGCAAALRLSQLGIDGVLVLDKEHFPRDKTCGSALSPNALRVLDELGLGGEVRRLGYQINGVRLVTPHAHELRFACHTFGYVLLRRYLDALLLEEARHYGADFRGGFRVTELLRQSGRVVGLSSTGGEVLADWVICADGAHTQFSVDPRPKQTISTVMGWWENVDFESGIIEMIFDRKLAPLYGWLFPESATRVNIGICVDGRPTRNIRDIVEGFLADHYTPRLRKACRVGRWQGHPISYTTLMRYCAYPGAMYVGEASRAAHNVSGEGIYQSMQSGIYAAETIASLVREPAAEAKFLAEYSSRCRRQFTPAALVGLLLRAALTTPLLDCVAWVCDKSQTRAWVANILGSALAGASLSVHPETVRKS